MKKYLPLLIVASALLWFPLAAGAAAQAPGTMPAIQPLQPLPPGIKANVSRNIQDSAASDSGVNPAGGAANNNPAAGQDNSAASEQAPGPVDSSVANPNTAKPAARWPVIVALVLAAGALAYFWLRRRPGSKNLPKNLKV